MILSKITLDHISSSDPMWSSDTDSAQQWFFVFGRKKNKITTAKHWNQNVISFSCCGFYSVFCIHYDRIRFKHTINRFDLWFDRQLLKYEKKTCGTFEGKKTEFLSFSGKQNSIRKKRINFKQIENILIVSTKFSSCDSFIHDILFSVFHTSLFVCLSASINFFLLSM